MNLYQEIIYKSKYAKWVDSEGRRENWEETVDRYIGFFKNRYSDKDIPWQELRDAVYKQEIMPSMRALMTAGKALEKDNIAAFNCSYSPIDSPKVFDEAMYILMCGAGIGFSVERQYINQLPEIAETFSDTDTIIIIKDSKIGWATAFRELLSLLWNGQVPKWDMSKIRPKGAKLKTFGGRASGKEPLEALFKFAVQIFKGASGRKLTSIECHDLMCKVAEVVVSGGVRRCLPENSMISTRKGLKKIKDITIDDEVATGKDKYSKVIAVENTGLKNMIAIKTQLGVFESSYEHRWAVLSDLEGGVSYKEAKDLAETDTLVFIPETTEGTKTQLPSWLYNKPKMSSTCKDITIPELDEELAWFFGQLHGDGYVGTFDRKINDCSDKVTIACANTLPEQHKRVMRQLERFGIKINPKHMTTENCSKPEVASKQLAEYLSQFKKPKISIDIPTFILEGTSEIRAAYIAGLFDADGSLRNRPICVASSVYPEYLKQVQGLLASLGIPSCLKLDRKENYKPNWKSLYRLNLIGQFIVKDFGQKIGKYSSKWEKDSSFVEKRAERGYVVPENLLKKSSYKKLFSSSYCSCRRKSAIYLSFHKFIKTTNKEFTYLPIKVVGVEKTEIEKNTYDIQVENDACFLVSGILTHNSSLISLSNVSDDRMRVAKNGQWWIENPQRQLANNSAVYTERPDTGIFIQEWLSLYNSKSGERGIINRKALQAQAEKTGRRDSGRDFGMNPCAEIILRPNQVCNLSEVIIRDFDTIEAIQTKVKLATILGTLQATLSDFRYLRKIWTDNTKEEALLGVSLTGIMDNINFSILSNMEKLPSLLDSLKNIAITTNKEYAEILGINSAMAITAVKPSGTVSQLVNSSSGIHPRFSKFFIRRIRLDKKDPISSVLIEHKIPYEEDLLNTSLYIFSFPQKSPDSAICVEDINAIKQLEHWLHYRESWCEHNPSITVYVKEEEWLDVGAWVYKHFDSIGGVSFLPLAEHTYKQQPYESISEKEYLSLIEDMPVKIDWDLLKIYEQEDKTIGSQELACTSGSCEL